MKARGGSPVKMGLCRIFILGLACASLGWGASAQADLKLAPLQAFFKNHCIQCHGPDKQKGKVRLDTLRWDATHEESLEIWQAVVDQLSEGEMPPKKEPRPAASDVKKTMQSIQSALTQLGSGAHRHQAVLRRLNRWQYRNTIRDLLHIDVAMDDPTSSFPSDDVVEGFDNIGDGLMMSDFLLRQYLTAARSILDHATFEGSSAPKPEIHRLFEKSKNRNRRFNFASQSAASNRGVLFLYMNDEREPGDTRGQTLTTSRTGAPHDGFYEFEFDIESKGRGNYAKELGKQKRKDWQVYHPEDLHRFEIYLSAPHGATAVQTRRRILVEAIDMPDNQRMKIKRKLWVIKGWRVEVAFGNAYATSTNRNYPNLIGAKYDRKAFEKMDKRKQNSYLVNLIHDQLEKGNGPRIAVYAASERGPLYDTWPPKPHQVVYGKKGQPSSVAQVVQRFAERAFRRPVSAQEVAPYVALAKKSPEGVRTAIEAILCSPRFLYFQESAGPLDSYALASRLSYFLWNTMPDESLLDLAAKNRLRDPSVLRQQVDRMLADSKSDEFVSRFVWQWLKLQSTIDMAPDPVKFYDYKRYRIAGAMVKESELFFRHVLDQNLPVKNFIDSNFTFVNADLARRYDLKGVNTTAKYQKVSLNNNRHRGGLLGQTSVLTASANGVDTSPVVRGIWILENLLGTPPKPPPDDVEIPEPDARGNLTIKQMYAKHRTVESCRDCHKKIDPIGFALEAFDAVGRPRSKYDSGHVVDTTGQMPNGQPFKDVVGMKQIMLDDVALFRRNLTTKLMTYASGRIMEVADRAVIDQAAATAKAKGDGLRDLVHAVVVSKVFLNK